MNRVAAAVSVAGRRNPTRSGARLGPFALLSGRAIRCARPTTARSWELEMFSRRDFLQVAAATAAIVPGGWSQALAQQRLTQDELLRFDPLGNVTLVHVTDIHAQLMPLLFREPSANLGVGEAKGLVPHVTGRAFLDLYNIKPGIGRGLRADLRRLHGARQELRPDRRPRPHRHHRQDDPRRARRPRAVPRRRRHLAEQLHVARQQGPGHGRLHGAAQAGRHDRALGVHARRRAGEGTRRASSSFRSWRRTCATPNGTSRRSTP